jgi:DNA-binding MarR family transcriptional regulator
MTKATSMACTMAAHCLCFRARRLARALTHQFDEHLRPLGIQAPQLMLLGAVALSSGEGLPMRVLAGELGMDATTLSRNVRPLEGRGLLRVVRSAEDARVRHVLLTREGERLLEAAMPIWNTVNAEIVGTIGPASALELRHGFDDAFAALRTHPPTPDPE